MDKLEYSYQARRDMSRAAYVRHKLNASQSKRSLVSAWSESIVAGPGWASKVIDFLAGEFGLQRISVDSSPPAA